MHGSVRTACLPPLHRPPLTVSIYATHTHNASSSALEKENRELRKENRWLAARKTGDSGLDSYGQESGKGDPWAVASAAAGAAAQGDEEALERYYEELMACVHYSSLWGYLFSLVCICGCVCTCAGACVSFFICAPVYASVSMCLCVRAAF